MNLCSDGHDEVCFETAKCPCCVEMRDRDKQIENLTEDRDIFEKRVVELETKIERLEEGE